MEREELEIVLKDHLHWLNEDVEGWEDMKADLSYINLGHTDLSYINLSHADLSNADLRYADLSNTNLSYADLSGANLIHADLRYTNLMGADLSHADLSNADLRYANLSDTDLKYADLSHANLSNADLRYANLSDTDLKYADLRGADLSNADLRYTNLMGANLSGINLSGTKGTLIEFRKGKMLTEDIIGYKKCRGGVIVKLLIPRGAIVFSINGRKCRTNKAKVLEIEGATRAISQHKYMSYYVGDEFTVQDFNCEYNVECASGIHFFMTREDAVNY